MSIPAPFESMSIPRLIGLAGITDRTLADCTPDVEKEARYNRTMAMARLEQVASPPLLAAVKAQQTAEVAYWKACDDVRSILRSEGLI